MTPNLDPYRSFMIELAERSGEFIRPFFANPELRVEIKADQTPVTLADRGAEELMRRMIRKKFPGHGIVGEEFDDENAGAEFVWSLDPVDGTRAFAAACPLFGTIIALVHQGQPILGLIHQPVLRQLMIGDGAITTLNGRPTRVRPCSRVEDATLLTSDPFNPAKHRNGPAFDALARRVRLLRTWGDCYGYLLVAGGWADVMCDPVLNPWDIQPLVPVIRGAGGAITDWQGGDPVKADSVVAAGPELHAQIVAALNP
jgi:histidinol phosphatase-like enzyme (inositol monophosphatase family)